MKNINFRRVFYLFVFLSLSTASCRSSLQAQVVNPVPTPTENQCQPPANLPLPNPSAEQTVWRGKSGDYNVVWTTHDISAVGDKTLQTTFSLARFSLRKTVEEFGAAEKWFCDYEDFRKTYKILSLVGSLVSLEETSVTSPQTSVTIRYRTVDLTDENRKMSLTDYFPADAVFAELMKNSLIKKSVARRTKELSAELKRKVSAPTNVEEFFKLFDGADSDSSATTNGANQFFIKKDLLDAFAFKQIKNGKVAIEMLLPATTGNRADAGFPVQLQLNVPASLKMPLAKANLRREGFLSKDKNSVWRRGADSEYLSADIILASNR